ARYNADGTLDTTFGAGGFGPAGTVTTDFDGGDDVARAVVLQGSRIVVAGSAQSPDGSQSDFALARYDVNGDLDSSVPNTSPSRTDLPGPAGTVTTDFSPSLAGASALTVTADGQLVAVGSTRNTGRIQFAVVRYGADGTPDPTFGTGGATVLDFGNAG